MMDEVEHILHDWREGHDSTLAVRVSLERNAICISEPDSADYFGRSVWVEFEDDALCVYCYDGGQKDPVSLKIDKDSVSTMGGEK